MVNYGIYYSKKLNTIIHISSYYAYGNDYSRFTTVSTYVIRWIIIDICGNDELWENDIFDTNIEEVYDLITDSDIIENIADTKYIISRIVHELKLEEIEMICKIDMVK